MRLQNLQAIPHPAGNRIDLSWQIDPSSTPSDSRVTIVRREERYPTTPTDGTVVFVGLMGRLAQHFEPEPRSQRITDAFHQACAELGVLLSDGARLTWVEDTGHLFDQNDQLRYVVRQVDVDQGLTLYDEQQPFAVDEGLRGETVYYYSFFPAMGDQTLLGSVAAMATSPYHLDALMYDLLPAIYRRYDERVQEASPQLISVGEPSLRPLQRFLKLAGGQLDQLYSLARALPQLYDQDHVDGRLLPLLADWIGWRTDPRRDFQQQRDDLRVAPYVQETVGTVPVVDAMVKRLNGWSCCTKEYANNVFRSNEPERLNLWAMQHNDSGWAPGLLSLDYAYEGRPSAIGDEEGQLWLFYHTLRQGYWEICYKFSPGDVEAWTPSVVLQPSSRQKMNRHPTACFRAGKLHLFWDVYDMEKRRWSIVYYRRVNDTWIHVTTPPFNDEQYVDQVERKQPWVVAAPDQCMWLFWLERTTTNWQVRYRRYDGLQWLQPNDFPAVSSFGFDEMQDLFVLNGPDDRLYVFWSHRVLEKDGGKYWRIFYRAQQRDGSWGEPVLLPPQSDADDREPAAFVNGDTVELFWSSNRNGSWSIWHCTLPNGERLPLTGGSHTQRAPLPISTKRGTTLFYRSSESITYNNPSSLINTIDTRYAGCTTVDTRNSARIAIQGQFSDFNTYTYDTSSKMLLHDEPLRDKPLYARDTVGIYIDPPAGLPKDQEYQTKLKQLEHFLTSFLPIQIRPIFLCESPQLNENLTTVIGRVLDGTNGNIPVSGAIIKLGAREITSDIGGQFTLIGVPITEETITVDVSVDERRLRAIKKMTVVAGGITNFGDIVINRSRFWDGGGGDRNWQNPANWNDDTLPQEVDDVFISATATVEFSSGAVTVNSLHCDGVLTIKGGTLAVADASTINTFTLINGTLAGSGDVTVNGDFAWSGGTMEGIGRTVVLGTLAIGDRNASRVALNGRTLENRGTVICKRKQDIGAKNSARIINSAEATWEFQNGGRIYWTRGQGNGEQPRFENQGAVVKSGSETTTLFCTFENQGTVNVEAGTLHLNGGGSGQGAYSVDENATLQFGGKHSLDTEATISGLGTLVVISDSVAMNGEYDISGATTLSGGKLRFTPGARLKHLGTEVSLSFSGALDLASLNVLMQNLRLSGGTVTLSGELTVNGVFTWTDGTIDGGGHIIVSDTLNINHQANSNSVLDSCTLENRGTVVWNRYVPIYSDYVHVKNGACIVNSVGAAWEFQRGGNILWREGYGEQAIFENHGKVSTYAEEPITICATFLNAGRLQLRAGTMLINGDFTQTDEGWLCISPASAMEDPGPGPLQVKDAVNLAGSLEINCSNDYLPEPGTRVRIVKFKEHTGEFAEVEGDDIDDARLFEIRYEDKEICLEVVKKN